MRSFWTGHNLIEAILLYRFLPFPSSEREALKRREVLRTFASAFLKCVPATALDHPCSSLLELACALLEEENPSEADALYGEAYSLLKANFALSRGDEKKWPSLSREQRTARLFSNYFADHPGRFALEERFRRFHLELYLRSNASLEKIQQELRSVLACFLKIDLSLFYEEVETASLASNRDGKEEAKHLLSQALDSRQEKVRSLSPLSEMLQQQGFQWDALLQPLISLPTAFKEIDFSGSCQQLVELVRNHPQHLTLRVHPSIQCKRDLLLARLLELPFPDSHALVEMPTVPGFKNLQIVQEGKTLVEFDEGGRLKSGEAILEVAIIGAGPGGISAAVSCMAFQIFDVVLFERNIPNSTVKEIWSREKEADTFYGGPPSPIEGIVGMEDTNRAVFLHRMQSFIDYFHLDIRNKEPVLELCPEGPLWKVKTAHREYLARHVIMSAGRYGKPKLLKWEEENLSPEIRNRIIRGIDIDAVENKTVLVVGGGNSAFDYVRSLTGNGSGKKNNTVYLSYPRKPFNVPASLHAHHNDQLLQWEAENKLTLLWNTNTQKVELVEQGGVRRMRVGFKEENQAPLMVDYIAPAVGWQIDKELMEKVGVYFIEGKNPDVDLETHQAFGREENGERIPIPGLYITGDYAVQKSVPAALTSNFRAVKEIFKRRMPQES